MREILPGWFVRGKAPAHAKVRTPIDKLLADAYIAGKRAGQAEMLKLATATDGRVEQLLAQSNNSGPR